MNTPRPSRSTSEAGEAALRWASSSGEADRLVQEVETRIRKRRRRTTTTALAALCTLAFLTLPWIGRKAQDSAESPGRTTSTVTEAETRSLPDGSFVELKPGARLSVHYSSGERRISLDLGEAHFSVSKDKSRPFIVMAAGVEVRAVGTTFSVEVSSRRVDVLVTEGSVALDCSTPSLRPSPAPILAARQRATIDIESGSPSIHEVAPNEISQRLAWRVPRLQFDRTPLIDAVTLYNRYGTEKLTLLDQSLYPLEVSGVIRADDVDSLVMLVTQEFGIHVTKGENKILLSR